MNKDNRSLSKVKMKNDSRAIIFRLFFVVIVLTFLAELVLMEVFDLLKVAPSPFLPFLDAFLLILILAPVFYFTVYQSLVRIVHKQLQSEEMRQRIEEERSLVEHLFNLSPDGILLSDETGRIRLVNRRAEKMFGYRKKDFLSKSIEDLLPERYRHKHKGLRAKYLQSPEDRMMGGERALWALRQDGQEFPVSIALNTFEFKEDCLVVSTVRDISQQRDLKARSRQLSSAIEQTEDMVLITDKEGRIEYVNAAFERVTGFKGEEVLGKTPRILKSETHDASFYEKLWKTILKGQPFQALVQNKTKEGRIFYEQKTISVLKDAEGNITHFVSTGKDVTKEKELEEQLLHSQKMESIGRLAGGVAHDFNNFLTAIQGYGELIQDRLTPEDPNREYIDEVLKASRSAADVTRQLLAFSRRQTIQLQRVEIVNLLQQMKKMLARLIGEDIELKIVPPEDEAWIEADPAQIDQVLMNLIVNARDAMPKGGQLIVKAKQVYLSEVYTEAHFKVKPGEYLEISVSDTGQGMTEEVQKEIFEPFFTTKEKGQGTGLGLSMVYGIVKQHQGHIRVYSTPNIGTTFRLYFPLAKPAEGEEDEEMGEPIKGAGGEEVILVVEDEGAVRRFVSLALREYGYTVFVASSGEEALSVFKAHEDVDIDLLLTDVIMPGMSGRELAQKLQERLPRLKVLFMSGYTDDVIGHHGMLEAGFHLIEKPFTKDELAKQVKAELTQRG